MNSQWGRDGRAVQPGTGGKVARFLAIFIALDVGIVAGYGLSRFLDDSATTFAVQITDQQAEIERLQQRLTEVTSAADGFGELQDENARLKSEVDQLYSDIAALQADQSGDDNELRETISTLRAQLSEERTALDKRGREISEFQVRLADLEETKEKLAEVESELKASQSMVAELQARLEIAGAAQTRQEQEISELRERLATAAEQTIPELEAEIARLKASPQPMPQATGDKVTSNQAQTATTQRDRQNVLQSMASAPGIANYNSEQREKLVGLLVSGTCVTTSLEEALGDVSVVLLAHLIKEFGGDC